MNEIPDEFKRITEQKIDAILKQHLSTSGAFADWLVSRVFPSASLRAIEAVEAHRHYDHRTAAGNPLAFGETDVEVVALVQYPSRGTSRVGILIEDKVDARQADSQGPRYRARGAYRQLTGSWDDFRCILVAPQRYLNGAYTDGGHRDDWDALVAFEDVASVLQREPHGAQSASVLREAADLANAWNKPIPSAVQFWKDLVLFQRAFHPNVPIFAAPQQGARINVWPSFFENQLRGNRREIRRKRVQLVHSGSTHVSLFIKNVKYSDFAPVAAGLIEPGMSVGAPGTSWQSIQLRVSAVDPRLGVEPQAEKLDKIFEAAERLYRFFVQNEEALLAVPTFK